MPSTRRCIVIGAGLLGLSAACALSRRDWSVDVLEAGDAVGHPFAGSKGDARIFRLGYPEPHYVEMAIAARALWRRLEESTGRRLLVGTGQLSFGDTDAVEALADALARRAEPFERLSSLEASARFPGVVPPGPTIFEPESGVLAADECLRALCDAGTFDLRTSVRAGRITSDGDGATVRCVGGESLRADVVVDCAGPGALALISDEVHQVHDARSVGAPPSLPQVAYFRSTGSEVADPSNLPVFIEWGDAMVYGLPVLGPGASHPRIYKVSHHTPGPALSGYDPSGPPSPAFGTDDPELLGTLTDAVRRLLPGLDPEPVATERCVYDNSADTNFVLDRVGNIVVGCGTSGHGFKFGPLLGELLADLAEGTRTPGGVDLAPFRLDRSGPPLGQRHPTPR